MRYNTAEKNEEWEETDGPVLQKPEGVSCVGG